MSMGTRGQSTAEYAILVGVVVAAIVAMQLYVKRGMQAKVADVADSFTSVTGPVDKGTAVGVRKQYEPYYAQSNLNVTQATNTTDAVAIGGKATRTVNSESTTRTGTTTQGTDQGQDAAWR